MEQGAPAFLPIPPERDRNMDKRRWAAASEAGICVMTVAVSRKSSQTSTSQCRFSDQVAFLHSFSHPVTSSLARFGNLM
jgi:hypothetical protein